jgi:hypothetical protein
MTPANATCTFLLHLCSSVITKQFADPPLPLPLPVAAFFEFKK